MKENIEKIIKHFDDIAGELWDGDEAGIGEDRAHIASDIIGTAKELLNLLEEFENL